MKRQSLSLVLVLALLISAIFIPRAAYASGEAVRGELNGWGTWSMSSSLGGTFIHTTGNITAPDDPSSEFKFYKDSNQWYSNGSAITFAQIFSGMNTSTGPNMSFNHVQNRYYVFKWDGSSRGVVFQLSDSPAAITAVSQSPTQPLHNQSVTVQVTLDKALLPEQAVFLRYTTNAWSSSTVVKMTGSGTSYSASIPAQMPYTTVIYYVFTSGNVTSIAAADADLMTITYNDNGGANYSYTLGAPFPHAKALWLDAGTIAWAGTAGSSYKLLYDPDGAIVLDSAQSTACSFPLSAPCYVTLTSAGTVSGYAKNPNATGLARLTLSLTDAQVKELLKGELIVASYDGGGSRLEASRVQIQSVLDALYATNAKSQTLGVTYSGGVPTVRVWAPTARSVTLRRYANSTTETYTAHAMTLDAASGVWSITGDSSWNRQYYLFDVEVYTYDADQVLHNLVTDPYAVSLSTDSKRSQFVNLDDADLKPSGWDAHSRPALSRPEDITIYEMHIRDFSINDSTVAEAHRGTYKAFTYDGAGPNPNTALSDGMAHLLALHEAGLTHVHLLPTFDIASVPEASVPRTVWPAPSGYAGNSSQQQAIIAEHRSEDGFNWGYDPYHYGVPEGSYSTNPDGVTRIYEFREMVQTLHQNGLRVVMDMVYNHTSASALWDSSVLDKVVPGYYYRYTTDGYLYTDSCCSDTATEYEMMEKLMVDTLVRWATAYRVDGFRFDLMNFHTRQSMLNVKSALETVEPTIYLYGEGWDFGSAKHKGLTTCPQCYAKKDNMTGTDIGSFNDIVRDAVHGGYSTDTVGIRQQGFSNGLSYDWNGYDYAKRYASDLYEATDKIRSALRGSIWDWNGQGAPFAADPQESVPYVEKHDNETLFDQNVFKLPNGDGSGNPGWIGSGIPTTAMSDRMRAQNVAQSIIALSQGVPFFQMGTDLLRSKSLDRNSYDSGDWFNRVYWDKSHNNFGVGLPPAWDNESRWGIMSPLLANSTLTPTTTDIAFAAAQFREFLRIRYSSPLFRLSNASDIAARTTHYNTDNAKPGMIVYALSDTVDPDLDPNYETILVFFNANKISQSITISGADGFNLHTVQADTTDADPVVQSASFNDATDTFTIPARTTAVFVSPYAITPPSTLDWVGLMWPRGGVAHQIVEGSASGGFDVYVQVYEAGVTPGAGQGAGIACFLHWGKYGQTWNDLAMAYNTDKGNNDEYKATIPQATLNTLGPGTYGFTAYCKKTSEAGVKWKQDAYNIDGNPQDDDQGDGLITIVPANDPKPAPAGGAFVHLFEWRWADIAKECPYLAEKGYSAVQVSPPNEHVVPVADMGGPENDYPWWARYQPVSYLLDVSRSGTRAEFEAMVQACNAVGVDIYADVVINHMGLYPSGTVSTGTAGTEYLSAPKASRYYGTGTNQLYTGAHFHDECSISDYKDRAQVQGCALSGLPDLATEQTYVRQRIRAYLQALLDLGVKGFRVDGAKHIPAQDIAAIFDGLSGDYYVFQEVIDQDPQERIRDWEYTPNGDVTEFAFPYIIGDKFDDSCSGTLSGLQNLESSLLPSRFAIVFSDNHDNQRGHGVAPGQCIVDHRDGQEHVLANIFILAYPYGYPSIMSSYYWQSDPTNNFGDSYGPPTVNGGPGSSGATLPVYADGDDIPDNCTASYTWGKWACEHRRDPITAMVQFRRVTAGGSVNNWQSVNDDHIAFGVGDKGFVVINQSGSSGSVTYQTALPAGTYCESLHGSALNADGSGCTGPSVTVNGAGQFNATVANNDALALHVGARVGLKVEAVTAQPGVAFNSNTTISATVTQDGAPLNGVTVRFLIKSGNGSLSAFEAQTNSYGVATVTFTGGNTKTVTRIAASYGQATDNAYVHVGAATSNVMHQRATAGQVVLDRLNEWGIRLIKEGNGTPLLGIGTFSNSPCPASEVGTFYTKSPFVDAFVQGTNGVDSVTITVHYPNETGNESNFALYWCDNGTWKAVSGATQDTASNLFTFTATSTSTPALSQLLGTPFVVGGSEPTALRLRAFAARPSVGAASGTLILLALVLGGMALHRRKLWRA